jgi:osmoprotectant transport system permease protein
VSALALGLLLGLIPAHAQAPASRAVVVGSKPFGESFLLAEMFAQLLEARGFTVDRRLGLGSTAITFGALRTGAIDVYPEYTGTGLLAVLNEHPMADPIAVFNRVATVFRQRHGIRWLPPLGFENTYAIAVRRETAERLGLATLSDLARSGGALTGGFSPDFLGRADGLPGLAEAYGLQLRETRALSQAVKYAAIAAGQVDVVDGYSTDGLLARHDLVTLEDDQRFFPPYQAAALVGADLSEMMPAAVLALSELSGRLDVVAMRRFNERIEVDGESIPRVASDALQSLGLIGADTTRAGTAVHPAGSLTAYLVAQRHTNGRLTLRHLLLVGVSLVAAIALAVPLGLLLERARGSAEPVIRAVGVLQTLPSIALLAFMIPLLGVGVLPAVVALFLYSLYPILRNTFTGVRDANVSAVAAARALGMTPVQVLRHVRLPLAAPVIMAGIRTAAVINVGTATLAAFIGAGGLGDPIVAGLALSDERMILSGALPAALLAVLVDGVLAGCERVVRPGG